MEKKNMPIFTVGLIATVAVIIATLTYISISSLNDSLSPQERDDIRENDVTMLLNHLYDYKRNGELSDFVVTDSDGNNSSLPGCPSTSFISEQNSDNLDTFNVSILDIDIPRDPSSDSDINTGYTICINKNYTLELSAPLAETRNIAFQK